MLSFQWNSLKPGDRVMVHDDFDPGLKLWEGVVQLVEQGRWYTNDVGIRIDHHIPVLVRPRRHAVHLLPLDRSSCWRCEAIVPVEAKADLDKAAA